MPFNIDEWIPNFKLFILILTPVLIILIYALTIIFRVLRIKSDTVYIDPTRHRAGEVVGYFPIIYFFFPVWDILEYMWGNNSFDYVISRLFTLHFPVLMTIIVLVGIMQVTYWIFIKRSGGDEFKKENELWHIE